jgi:hypothetical protein
MSAEQRLDRLYPALTAKERGLLVLHAYKAGEQPDRLIYSTTPSGQRREFNRYIRLMNACNVELATMLVVLREQIGKTDLKYAWFMTLCLWGIETQFLGDEVLARTKDRTLRRDVRRMMRRAPGDLQVPVDLTLPHAERDPFKQGYGDEMVRAVLFGIKQGLEQHWCELRSIEIALAEVAEEFGGEDPLQPDVRALIDGCLATCTTLRDQVADYVEIELAEPAEEDISPVRALIETVVEKG